MKRSISQRVFQASKGGFTVAVEVLDDFSVLTSFALCNAKDQFARKTGRTKAVGRLKALTGTGKLMVTTVPTPPTNVVGVKATNDYLTSTVFRPLFAKLEGLNHEDFRHLAVSRVGTLTHTITSAFAPVATY